MITGMRIMKFAGIIVLCLGSLSSASAARAQKKVKKPPPLPPLPSGPTGPIQQVPLDLMAPVAPQVSYQSGQLTIIAPNSTLGDILRAVRKQTGAEIEVPDAKERVVTHLGPAPAAEVMAELLNGSRFNYVLLGSPDEAHVLTKVVLVAKSGPDNAGANRQLAAGQQPAAAMAEAQPPDQQEMAADQSDADAAEEQPVDDNADQSAAEAEQPVAQPDQPGIKTPQQLLQEMQQRQLQLQQQQQVPGQPPIPGPVQRPQEQ